VRYFASISFFANILALALDHNDPQYSPKVSEGCCSDIDACFYDDRKFVNLFKTHVAFLKTKIILVKDKHMAEILPRNQIFEIHKND
jgi:hypothetical protein